MKNIIFTFLVLFSSSALAEKNIQLDPIGYGKLLKISAHIQLPHGQKLNNKAPSKMAVFEKAGDQWALTEEVNLNEFFSLTELINFQRPIQLKSDKSEIKLTASLYHCPRVGSGICVIDDFAGIIKRHQKKSSSEIKVSLRGSDPK